MLDAYDVCVVGAGVVGSAIARAISGFDTKVVLVEALDDVGEGTSKANTAILHTGFDAKPGTLESRMVRRGYTLLNAYAQETGIPLDRTGAILVAWDEEQLQTLPALQAKAEQNGYLDCFQVDDAEVYRRLPDLGHGALGGLVVPGESIICTWSTVLALATDAVNRGCDLKLSTAVTGFSFGKQGTTVATSQGEIKARWVVNAAGLSGDVIDGYAGYERFRLHPRRGELLVMDKLARSKVPNIVLPVPSKVGKGVLVSPTIFGNVMVGPTAEDMEDRSDTSTTEEGFAFLREKAARIMPSLLDEEVTASYAGLRAAHDQSDYRIEIDHKRRYLVAGCIRSTGLTSAMAVAEYVVQMLQEAGFDHPERDGLPIPPKMPPTGEHQLRPFANEQLIEDDPDYGRIICFCERVTAGEIRDALNATIPATGVSGVRKRTRARNGRCQGFFCGAELQEMVNRQVTEPRRGI